MTVDLAITSQQIRQAVAALKKLRPGYADLLNFYEKIFTAQEDSKGQINLDPIEISTETLALKRKEKFSLIGISEFVVDQKAATALFKQLCQITETGNDEMADAARAIQNALASTQLDLKAVFAALLNTEDAYFKKIEKDMGIEKKALAFMAYNSIKPSLVHGAEQLASYLDADNPWDKGFCPVCGSTPGFSLFEDEGNRILFCGFCWHQWTARRIYCPFCENQDSNSIHYYFSEQEKNYRIDVCDNCKTYLKAIDQRNTERIIYAPLEFVASLHLDIKAQEMGFKSGIQLTLQ
ncbi:MAG: formate dehydrogenase accessory protein FdhE [Deltaproteobacteria bacterium]|nr:formate dehydrogenase accessory protein FdhE [Deltaproteobacteria bacterium]